jgi:hypothetical protein
VSVTVTEPTILDLATTNIVNVGCKGASTGEISVSASGGTTAYQYNISGGAYTSSNVFKTLSAGTYTVGVKDKNGCTKSISVVISEPANALVVSVNSKVDVDCKGNSTGSITVGGSGGTPSYSFNINGGTYGSSSTFSGLVAGSYTMGIKDANGCTSSTVVSISEPTASLNGSTTQVNVSCNGLSDGSIALTPSGGTTIYKYYWTGPGTFTSTSQSPSSLLA